MTSPRSERPVGGARLDIASMPAADRLAMFARSSKSPGYIIWDVQTHRAGVVIELKLPGYTYGPPRRLLLKDLTRVEELIPRRTDPEPEPEWEQLQIDIGDEMHDRERLGRETDTRER